MFTNKSINMMNNKHIWFVMIIVSLWSSVSIGDRNDLIPLTDGNVGSPPDPDKFANILDSFQLNTNSTTTVSTGFNYSLSSKFLFKRQVTNNDDVNTRSPAYMKALTQCSKKANSKYSRKEGKKEMLDCCVGIEVCACIDLKCQDPKFASTAPDCSIKCMIPPPCTQYNQPQCDKLKTRPISYIIILIILAIIVALVVLAVICVVCYKKFHKTKPGKKGLTGLSISNRLNVSSRIGGGGGGHHSKKKNKSTKSTKSNKSNKSVKNASGSVGTGVGTATTATTAANPSSTKHSTGTKSPSQARQTNSFNSRTPKATTPSKATSTMTKETGTPSSNQAKVSRSTLQRAVM